MYRELAESCSSQQTLDSTDQPMQEDATGQGAVVDQPKDVVDKKNE